MHMANVGFVFFPFRVISIKNYHPKIRIITQMLAYHNKVIRCVWDNHPQAFHCNSFLTNVFLNYTDAHKFMNKSHVKNNYLLTVNFLLK